MSYDPVMRKHIYICSAYQQRENRKAAMCQLPFARKKTPVLIAFLLDTTEDKLPQDYRV